MVLLTPSLSLLVLSIISMTVPWAGTAVARKRRVRVTTTMAITSMTTPTTANIAPIA
jgi:hypothetical protein